MKTIYEELGGTYHQEGNYLIPDIVLPAEHDYKLGKYGRMRREYLKEHRTLLYTQFVLEGSLFSHLAEIDRACYERMDVLISGMAEREGVTESMKSEDWLGWVGRMNNIRSRAEEIVLTELVYV